MGAGDRDFGGGLRLAELLAALSLAIDLAHYTPLETALRDTLLAVGFGRHLGLTGLSAGAVRIQAGAGAPRSVILT